MSFDLNPFIDWIKNTFEPQMRVDGKAGRYARSVGDTTLELYGVSDMACVLHAINALDVSAETHANFKESFYELTEDSTGFIKEVDQTHCTMHNTAFALGGMNLLGIPAKVPLHFAKDYDTKEKMTAFLESEIDWENVVYGGSHEGAGLASALTLVPGTVPQQWFRDYFDYLDTKFDPNNGMMGINKPAGGDTDQIGGTFHYHFLYEHYNRRMPYGAACIDSVLAQQLDNGEWTETNPWWMTLDAFYLLTRSLRHSHHRADEVTAAIRKTVAMCYERIMDEDLREKYFGGHFAVHSLTCCTNIFAEAQNFLGNKEIISEKPLQLVLDRRPFI
ncbi:MAG: hypothetical protein HRT89_06170 [Lentisphaeria bacterium]|nr:hypothetical protein [Lentisphaeria bacterium]NQZ67638.1 hypothetical protein [Lentisphaeria bacterium]